MSNINEINGKDYEVTKLDNDKYTIVHKKTGNRLVALNSKVIGEYEIIYEYNGFLQGESNYCIVKQSNKKAILDIVNNQIITDWYDSIGLFGFIEGKSNYCIIKQNNKYTILDVFNNKIITNWYDWMSFSGFIRGQSNYCIVKQNEKYAILDVLNNKIITNWHNNLKPFNFMEGKSKYSKFKLLNNDFVYFNLLNKIYQDSLLDKFIMTVKFKESLWEYWYKCF